MEVCGWGTVGWASREIAGDTAAHTASTKASAFCNRNPPQTLSSQTPDPPPVCLFFFRSVAHGAEKIVFITCQHLAALSYATQDSIKLSYTGMKLQNRPGTPQQNYFIPPPKKIGWRVCGCEVRRWQVRSGGDRRWGCRREMWKVMWSRENSKRTLWETVLHTQCVIK